MAQKFLLDFSYQNIINLQYLDSSEDNYQFIKNENGLILKFLIQNIKIDDEYSLSENNKISFVSKLKIIKDYPLTSTLKIEDNNVSYISKVIDAKIIEKLNERFEFLMKEKKYF